ncbi:MAG: hypothetical protein IKH57_17095 [Clostridia bacterium]|nr:hypothetical protein [Clostridia bacterium]
MKVKRTITIIVLLVLLTSLLPLSVNAAALQSKETELVEEEIQRAEQTQWYYRINNGVLEKRLWSITYQRWLTDWIPVN